MEINKNLIIVNNREIGEYDLYDVSRLVCTLTPSESLQETLLTGASTLLEVLQNAADQRVISSFQIVHHP